VEEFWGRFGCIIQGVLEWILEFDSMGLLLDLGLGFGLFKVFWDCCFTFWNLAGDFVPGY
jgi:hypothetical protein